MSDMTFSEQIKAYDRWKQERGGNWHSPERYEEWLELTRKADLWDQVVEIWLDEDQSARSLVDFVEDRAPE